MANVVISAILLAAGESRRMGSPKLLLPFKNSTILEQAVDNLLSSTVDEVIVVVGHKAEEMSKKLADRPVKLVLNPDFHKGMSTSIVKGLGMVDENAHAIMLVLADQPLIPVETINALIGAFLHSEQGIVVPVYQGKRGHPVIFDSRYRGKLQILRGDRGGKEIIDEYSHDVLELPVTSSGIHVDIDTPDNYRSLYQ